MAAQVIRDSVTMDQIIGLYGYRLKRGFMCCPFHGEKEPSLKVYPKTGGWHCFGCGRGGSVIDFVMEHENCSFSTAVRAIDKAMNLRLMDPCEYPEDANSQQRIQAALDRFVDAVNALCDAKIRIIELTQKMNLDFVKAIESKPKQEISACEWDVIHQWKEEEDILEYRKEKIEEFKEEVAAWRRRARRTG